jgi:hypothetical protein
MTKPPTMGVPGASVTIKGVSDSMAESWRNSAAEEHECERALLVAAAAARS